MKHVCVCVFVCLDKKFVKAKVKLGYINPSF